MSIDRRPWLTPMRCQATSSIGWGRLDDTGLCTDAEIDFLHLLVIFQIDRSALKHGPTSLQHIALAWGLSAGSARIAGALMATAYPWVAIGR